VKTFGQPSSAPPRWIAVVVAAAAVLGVILALWVFAGLT
jgi:hypothetical protein